jgi:hypothetical protein
MTVKSTMPYPLRYMLGYLDIDIGRSIDLMPEEMQAAAEKCRQCEKFLACDSSVESRYLLCPNRKLLDELDELVA